MSKEIDDKISDKIFKRKDTAERRFVPNYSTNMNEAMKVIEKLAEIEGIYIELYIDNELTEVTVFSEGVRTCGCCDSTEILSVVENKSTPLAICEAALKYHTEMGDE